MCVYKLQHEFGLTLFKFHHSIMFYINVIDMQISIEFFSTQKSINVCTFLIISEY
jgi:hypothetical protein